MSDLSSLQTAKSNLIARYEEVTANPQPTYSVDGQSVSHDAYRRSLLDEIARVNALLAREGDDQLGPFEEPLRGVT